MIIRLKALKHNKWSTLTHPSPITFNTTSKHPNQSELAKRKKQKIYLNTLEQRKKIKNPSSANDNADNYKLLRNPNRKKTCFLVTLLRRRGPSTLRWCCRRRPCRGAVATSP